VVTAFIASFPPESLDASAVALTARRIERGVGEYRGTDPGRALCSGNGRCALQDGPSSIEGSCRHWFVYAPFITAAKIRNGFFMCNEARMFDPYQSNLEALADDTRFDLYPCQAFTYQDQTCSSRPRSCSRHSDQSGSRRLVTAHDFFRDANAASRNSILAIPESIKDKRKSR
jgi:hypothetical protein